MKRRALLSGGAACFFPGTAISQSIDQQTRNAHPRALSGDRFQIGAQEYLLTDIMAPPLYSLGVAAPAYFQSSRATFEHWLINHQFTIEERAAPTRWAGKYVDALDANQKTAQEYLIAAGAARVAPQTERHEFIAGLLALEIEARTERRGLWALSDYRVFDAKYAHGAIGAFHLVSGVLLTAADTRSRYYLNFGADHKTDFTASARKSLYRRWSANGFDLATLEGKKLRIRGFVEEINGPSIDLKHPQQIELIAG